MSLVTTARLYFGQSRRLNRSTSAVFPEPTGPALPTRNALIDVDPFSRIPSSPQDSATHPPVSRVAVYQLAEKITPKLLSDLTPPFRFIKSMFPFVAQVFSRGPSYRRTCPEVS